MRALTLDRKIRDVLPPHGTTERSAEEVCCRVRTCQPAHCTATPYPRKPLPQAVRLCIPQRSFQRHDGCHPARPALENDSLTPNRRIDEFTKVILRPQEFSL